LKNKEGETAAIVFKVELLTSWFS